MYRVKVWIRMYFGFSRTETNAFLILIPLIFVALFSEPVYRNFRSGKPPDFFKENRSLDSLIATLQWNDSSSLKARPSSPKEINFHAFDPNLISEKEFIQLGLPQFLSRRIIRFREKGGKFNRPIDVLKIYGMDSAWYKKAVPWISIAQEKKAIASIPASSIRKSDEKVDINLADSLQLMAVYGIGSKLSRRILSFGNKLGGFVSMQQLKDVYGLDSAVIQALNRKFFVQENFEPQRKIKLNTATREEMLGNPYFRYKETDAILAFRLQHGPFTSVESLREIGLLTPGWIEKVRPYLILE